MEVGVFMINEILDEIRVAEKEAEEMVKKAAEDARQTVLDADEKCRIIRAETVKSVKEERRKVVEKANAEGDAKFAEIVNKGKEEAKKTIEATNTDKAVEFIKEKVLSGYVNR